MMKHAHLPGIFLFLMVMLPASRGQIPVDRIEVFGGAVLIGQIESVTEGKLNLQTPYAGPLSIDLSQVERVVTGATPPPDLPVALLARGPEAPVAVQAPARKSVKKAPVPEPEPPRGWVFEAGLNLAGSDGNTEKFDVTITVDAILEHEQDRLDLYGRYAYGTNRGNLSSDEAILGGRYSNYFFDGFGLFVREELERDDFEGILLRSTTASGLTWRIQRQKNLTLEARSGLSYRYEDYAEDGSADFPGLDFGVDVNWRFVPWMRFKGSYTFLPSKWRLDEYILEQDSGFNLPLDVSEMWNLRFGVSSKYNNQPEPGRENLDLRYYARLMATWH